MDGERRKRIKARAADTDRLRGCRADIHLAQAMHDEIESMERDLARMRRVEEAIRAEVARCRCKGAGKYELPCPFCDDSTHGHECVERVVDCTRCDALRAALADGKGET